MTWGYSLNEWPFLIVLSLAILKSKAPSLVVYSDPNGLPFTERFGAEPAAHRAAPGLCHDPSLGPMKLCPACHSLQKVSSPWCK
jgi:hypothetical protein